jgi:hypothetical protein
MNCNKIQSYEDLCNSIVSDCIVFVDTLDIKLAKNQILINCIDINMNSYISNFIPYKSRLELNIPLLQYSICKNLYLLLDQFYKLNENDEYCAIDINLATHEDVDELVVKMSTILSNKLLGKNIIDRNTMYNHWDLPLKKINYTFENYDHIVALMEYF